MSLRPGAFARAKAMLVAIQVAMGLDNTFERQMALNAIGPYRSRGKGGRLPPHMCRQPDGAWRQWRSKYEPAECYRAGHR